MKNNRRKLLWVTGAMGALVILLLLLFVALPSVINLRPVKTRILRDLSNSIDGEVTGKRIDVSLLPSLHFAFHQIHLSKDDKFSGNLSTLIAYPQIIPLMRGELKLNKLKLIAPSLEIKIDQRPADKGDILDNLKVGQLSKNVIEQLTKAAAKASALSVQIEDGQLRLAAKNRPPFRFSAINGSIQFPPNKLQVNMACESNLWTTLSVNIEIETGLAVNGSINVAGLQPQLISSYVLPPRFAKVADGDVNLEAAFESGDFQTLHLSFQGSVPRLTLVENGRQLTIKCERLKGSVDLSANKLSADVAELHLNYPEVNLSGSFLRQTQPARYQLFLKGKEVDVASTRHVSLALLHRFSVARKIFEIVRGGMVPEITFATHGHSVHDLGEAENIHIVGSMKNGNIFVPKADLDLTEVFGKVDISNGILTGENLRARLKNSTGTKADLRIGLRGDDAPFRLDILIDADLAQLPPILLRVVKNERFDNEINLIDSFEGKATGRLVLGDSLDSVKAVVDVADIELNAVYQRLPYPLHIESGGCEFLFWC